MATPMAISARPATAAKPMFATGGFKPLRIIQTPPGARIREGVRLVAVPRGAVFRGMATGGHESMAVEDLVYIYIELQRPNALSLLDHIEPLPDLVKDMEKLKSEVTAVVEKAKSRKPEKVKCAEDMVRLAYNISALADKCSTDDRSAVPSKLPKVETFVKLCFGRDLMDDQNKGLSMSQLMLSGNPILYHSFDEPELWPTGLSESDRKLMKAVMVAMNFSVQATARYLQLSWESASGGGV